MSNEFTIREAEESDVPSILEIYNHYILNSIATFDIEPQTLVEKREWFRLATSAPYCAFVALADDDVVGFSSLGPFRTKAAYAYSAEDSVYVRPERLGAGIGRALLETIVERAQDSSLRAIIARISGDNPASVAVHERCGFRHVGVERDVGYKFERWIDVVVMQLTLGD